MHLNKNNTSVTFHDFVKLSLYDVSGKYRAKPVCAIVASNLCCPVLLGLPFLLHNNLTIDHSNRTAIDESQAFDLLNPSVHPPPRKLKKKLQQVFSEVMATRKAVACDLKLACDK